MTVMGSRFLLFWLMVLFGVVHALVLFGLLVIGAIYSEDLTMGLAALGTTYAAAAGVVIPSLFTKPDAPQRKVNGGLLLIALGLTVLWNLLISARLALFVAAAYGHSTDSVEDVIGFLQSTVTPCSFAVTAALTYFFVKDSETKGAAPKKDLDPAAAATAH